VRRREKDTLPLKKVQSDTSAMPSLQTIRMQVEDVGNQWERNVTLTFDQRRQSWIASIASHMASSLVGPSDALTQVKTSIEEHGLDKTSTPSVGLEIFELPDDAFETQAIEHRDRPSFGIVLLVLVGLAVAAYAVIHLMGMK